METLHRKQVLKNTLIEFTKTTKNDQNVYSIQTDINRGYWIYKGQILDNKIFNLNAARPVKKSELKKDIVYYITTITDAQIKLFNL